GQVHKVRIVLRIKRRHIGWVIGEMGSPLYTGGTEASRHRRIDVRSSDVSSIEFIYDPGGPLKCATAGKGDSVRVDVRQKISLKFATKAQARRISLKRSALYFGIEIGIHQMDAMADVIKDRLFTSGPSHRSHHPVNEGGHFFRRLVVMWFIAYLKGNNVGIVFIGFSSIGVDVVQELIEVVLLGFDGPLIGKAGILTVFVGESGRVLVGLGPAITPIRDRRENELDATILHLRQHIVEKIEMFVFQQVAGRVTDLCIPYMNAISIEAQTGKMIYIGIDRFPQRNAKTLCRTISMGEGGGIVYAEALNFLACIAPAHRAVLVDNH